MLGLGVGVGLGLGLGLGLGPGSRQRATHTCARLFALDRHFPNRYAAYLETGGFSDAKKALELSGILRNGVVAPEFVSHPALLG